MMVNEVSFLPHPIAKGVGLDLRGAGLGIGALAE
ncbi:Hypothetical protein FNO222_1097 [Francisella orientalis]|uniref:Uncharacterized protein n=1 Tax=Francisella orientalis TaxID=299583 RepID=A0ABN4H5M0_9GAMM|nr:hypothetical protein M973_06125 [Francisella orientalis LADL 07-285A]AKN85714.1 hypothetical protein FNO12_1088 [Francisella orientalis FNO12]AKN87254.1 Hypothetical protein FNO24_1090 [Francisella orientalis FNO24]AKN88791.1 Hypothetical protein FNO190_1088 [Francisella orientalis]AKU05549.1 Hypothetical protein FNO01_1088 [Francisella orientalis]